MNNEKQVNATIILDGISFSASVNEKIVLDFISEISKAGKIK